MSAASAFYVHRGEMDFHRGYGAYWGFFLLVWDGMQRFSLRGVRLFERMAWQASLLAFWGVHGHGFGLFISTCV